MTDIDQALMTMAADKMAEMRQEREALRAGAGRARDTFRDLERVLRVVGKADLAEACGIARADLDNVLKGGSRG